MNSQQNVYFTYYKPKRDVKLVISIPHSGTVVPWPYYQGYLSNNCADLNQDVDFFVDQLIDIDKLLQNGCAIFVANIHRCAIDLNRAPDKAVIAWEKNSQGKQLLIKPLSVDQKEELLQKFYHPYFAAIDQLYSSIDPATAFIDLHSMPSQATSYHLAINPNQQLQRPDFCISDQHGKSCSANFITQAKQFFLSRGFHATINDPYVGGYITQYFMGRDMNNIQIEINRKLYMDEQSFSLDEQKSSHIKNHVTDYLCSLIH